MQLQSAAGGQGHKMSAWSASSSNVGNKSSRSSGRGNRFSSSRSTPQAFHCMFCTRVFRTAQALGGHMNIHRLQLAAVTDAPETLSFDQDVIKLPDLRRVPEPGAGHFPAAPHSSAPAPSRLQLFATTHQLQLLMRTNPPPAAAAAAAFPIPSPTAASFARVQSLISSSYYSNFTASQRLQIAANLGQFPTLGLTPHPSCCVGANTTARPPTVPNSDPLTWLFSQLPEPGTLLSQFPPPGTHFPPLHPPHGIFRTNQCFQSLRDQRSHPYLRTRVMVTTSPVAAPRVLYTGNLHPGGRAKFVISALEEPYVSTAAPQLGASLSGLPEEILDLELRL